MLKPFPALFCIKATLKDISACFVSASPEISKPVASPNSFIYSSKVLGLTSLPASFKNSSKALTVAFLVALAPSIPVSSSVSKSASSTESV